MHRKLQWKIHGQLRSLAYSFLGNAQYEENSGLLRSWLLSLLQFSKNAFLRKELILLTADDVTEEKKTEFIRS